MVSRLAVLMMLIGCGSPHEPSGTCMVDAVRTCDCLDGSPGMARCSDASPAIWTSCICAAAIDPVEIAQPDSPRNVEVPLDGTKSSDRNRFPLTYAWSLAAPAGSAAQLAGATSGHASFVPDVAGDYAVALTVDDGVGTASTTATVVVYDLAPVLPTILDRAVETGAPTALDLSAATDPDGDPITAFTWAVDSAPAGSTAQPVPANAASTSFTPDVDGDYELIATAGDGELTASEHVVLHSYRRISPLADVPIGAAYSAARDRIAMLSPAGVTIVDPATGTGPSVALTGATISISADGQTAVVTGDHAIALVDVATGTLAKTIPLAFEPTDAILGGTGYLYAFDGSSATHNIATATGVDTFSYDGFTKSRAVLSPDGKTIAAAFMFGVTVLDISAGIATIVDQLSPTGCGPPLFFASASEFVDTCGAWYGFAPIAKLVDLSIDVLAGALQGADLLAFTAATVAHPLDDTALRRFVNRALSPDATPLPHFLPADEQSHGSYLFAGPAGVRAIVHGATAWGVVRY